MKKSQEQALRQKIGDLNTVCGFTDFTFNDGPARGMRAFHLKNGAGIEMTVLADRGLDIPYLSFKGHQVGFTSKTGLKAPSLYTEDGARGFLRQPFAEVEVFHHLRNDLLRRLAKRYLFRFVEPVTLALTTATGSRIVIVAQTATTATVRLDPEGGTVAWSWPGGGLTAATADVPVAAGTPAATRASVSARARPASTATSRPPDVCGSKRTS